MADPRKTRGAAGPADEARPAGVAADALRRLEARLDRASRAAESLIDEMAGATRGSAREESPAPPQAERPTSSPPPAGWQLPGSGSPAPGSGEAELLLRALGAIRDLIPPELQRRIAKALRELLLAVRALIDWYLERAERRAPGPAAVRNIPIS